MIHQTLSVFAMLLSMLIISPLHVAHGTGMVNVSENDHIPKIGFYTVGDNVTVTLNFTNHSNERKYLKIIESFGPYSNPNGPFPAQHWQDISSTVDADSSTVVSHTFVAIDPEVWELIVDADGFKNYNHTGIADPSYSNQFNTYVHPSSDRDIRVLAQSMQNSSITAENNLNEIKNQRIVVIGTASASIALAVIVFWQTHEIRKQTKLAHMPYLVPQTNASRVTKPFGLNADFPLLLIANVGHGPALKIRVQVFDLNDNPISEELGFHAIFPHDQRSLGVDLTNHAKYKLKGYFYDLMGIKHKIPDIEHSYPSTYE